MRLHTWLRERRTSQQSPLTQLAQRQLVSIVPESPNRVREVLRVEEQIDQMLHWFCKRARQLSRLLRTTVFSVTARGRRPFLVCSIWLVVPLYVGVLKVAVGQRVTANIDERL